MLVVSVPIAAALALAFVVLFIFSCTYTRSRRKEEEIANSVAQVKRAKELKDTTVHAKCDEELAHSAHLYHYQQKKKLLLEREAKQTTVDEDEDERDCLLDKRKTRITTGGHLSDDSGRSSLGSRSSYRVNGERATAYNTNGLGPMSSQETVALITVMNGCIKRSTDVNGAGNGVSVCVDSNDVTTVYECNGLAGSQDFEEIEVRNPLFQHDLSQDTTNDNEDLQNGFHSFNQQSNGHNYTYDSLDHENNGQLNAPSSTNGIDVKHDGFPMPVSTRLQTDPNSLNKENGHPNVESLAHADESTRSLNGEVD